MSLELDFMLNIDAGGVVEKHDAAANIEILKEWLYTPVTTRYGNPSWGNNLSLYKHEPLCNDTARSIENAILLTLPHDCPNLPVSEIRCDPTEKDMYRIFILTSFGVINETMSI